MADSGLTEYLIIQTHISYEVEANPNEKPELGFGW